MTWVLKDLRSTQDKYMKTLWELQDEIDKRIDELRDLLLERDLKARGVETPKEKA